MMKLILAATAALIASGVAQAQNAAPILSPTPRFVQTKGADL